MEELNVERQVSRRSVAKGAAWAVPVIAVASAAPAYAASPCINTTLDWGAASTTKLTNGTVYRLSSSGSRTVYARVTYTESATQNANTQRYQLTVGRTAYGLQSGTSTSTYQINPTTGGTNDLVLNQLAGSGSTAVTIAFFSDQALTRPTTVQNLQVPLDDFSTQRTYGGFFGTEVQPARSYQELWSVTGTTATGSVTPSITAVQAAYNATSTRASISGSGTAASPWTFPANLTNNSRNSVGGNVITQFSAPVNAVTVTYASTSQLTGPQGAGLGRLTMCI